MKLPNVASLVALLLVILPAVTAGIEQVFPAAEWYWSPIAVTIVGAIGKALQETYAKPRPAVMPPGASGMVRDTYMAPPKPSKARQILFG